MGVWWLGILGVLAMSQGVIYMSHPFYVLVAAVVFGVLSSLALLLSGKVFMAVGQFLILMGGVMVVFSYAVALVPLSLEDKKKEHVGKKSKVKGGVFLILSLVLFLMLLKGSCSFPLVSDSKDVFFFSECFYFTFGWSKVMVVLSAFLFLVMVGVVKICKSQKGALVK